MTTRREPTPSEWNVTSDCGVARRSESRMGMTNRNRYQAVAVREPSWWIITIPELEVTTQSRRLDRIEQNARGAVATRLDVD